MVVRSHSDPPFMPGPCKSFLEPPWALGGGNSEVGMFPEALGEEARNTNGAESSKMKFEFSHSGVCGLIHTRCRHIPPPTPGT